MLHFDSNGYLFPHTVIQTDFRTFQSEFVDAVVDENRPEIFKNFNQFCSTLLQKLAVQQILVLLNGSFTTKKRNPNDLDVVVFIEWETYQKHKQLLREEYDHDRLLKNSRLDVYFLVVLPDDHPNYAFTESDRAYWINQFTRTRPNRRGTVYKKGFLQLILTNDEIE